jgi:hypothetical protein
LGWVGSLAYTGDKKSLHSLYLEEILSSMQVVGHEISADYKMSVKLNFDISGSHACEY